MQSGLGQPIFAEIPIYDTNDVDLQTLNIQFASNDSFRRLGLDPNRVSDIKLSIVSDNNGNLFVQLKSELPYNEPVLAVLLDAKWGNNGRLVKELTALVDPPYISKAAVQTINVPTVTLSPVVAPPSSAPLNPYRTPTISTGSVNPKVVAPIKKSPTQADKVASKAPDVKKPEPPIKKTEPEVVKEPAVQYKPVQPVQIPATANNQFTVEQGDNLNNIAITHSKEIGSRISLNQMMTAIQRANASAFIKDNPNLLKKGSILRLPDEEQVLAMMPEDSANLLKSQWAKNIKAQPAPVLDSANKLSSKTNSTKAAEPTNGSAESKTINQGRLKIVPTVGNMNNASSQSGASKAGQGQELRAESTQSQEEIATKQSEIVILKSQLTDAAKLQIESKRLIELQNSQIKLLTQRMQELENGTAKSTTNGAKPAASMQAKPEDTLALAPWYYNTNVVVIGLLLIAVLLGILLKRKK